MTEFEYPAIANTDSLCATQMRQLLIILTFCFTTTLYSQTFDDIKYFLSVKNDNDSTFKYFISFLTNFDSTDPYNNFFCEKASERVGDYYKSRHDYLRAIAYYDSADTKYRDKLQFCGNAYYIDFIPRRYKTSQCYLELKNVKQAVETLTPYVFDNFGSSYFDSAMTSYYLEILELLYSKQEIQSKLKTALDNIHYSTYYRWTLDSNAKYIHVNCSIKLFDTELELANFETLAEKNNQIPSHVTKEFFVTLFKELEIYRRLQN